jgi:excisionase family DNA binding protein
MSINPLQRQAGTSDETMTQGTPPKKQTDSGNRSTEMDRLLSTDEVAEWLQVPPSTVKGWRRNHKGPHYLVVGRHLRYLKGDVYDWLVAGADNSTESMG